jgi:type IV pilus assembly protein PilM
VRPERVTLLTAKKKARNIVGLDLDAGSVGAVEVRLNGSAEVVRAATMPLPPGLFHEGEVTDSEALASALRGFFAEHKLNRNVRLGIASQRVAVRLLELPAITSSDELETAVRFQAQDHIPMPLDQASFDWQVVGHTRMASGERGVTVIAVAARRDMLSTLLASLRDAGLRPEGIDLSAFGMIRAVAGRESDAAVVPYEARVGGERGEADATDAAPDGPPAKLYCNLGDVANLAVAQGRACLFTRVSSFGVEGIAQRLAERRNLNLEHARQWLVHVGLERPLQEIEGDPEHVAAARQALEEGASKLADELRRSVEYFAAQPGAMGVEGVVACGPGTRIPGLAERLQDLLDYEFEIARPRALAGLDDAASARLTLAYGIALEE